MSAHTIIGLCALGYKNRAAFLLDRWAYSGNDGDMLARACCYNWRDFKEDVRSAVAPVELAARHLLGRSRHATWH